VAIGDDTTYPRIGAITIPIKMPSSDVLVLHDVLLFPSLTKNLLFASPHKFENSKNLLSVSPC
jgi:hypothetical protein